jgi:hypothetical protein
MVVGRRYASAKVLLSRFRSVAATLYPANFKAKDTDSEPLNASNTESPGLQCVAIVCRISGRMAVLFPRYRLRSIGNHQILAIVPSLHGVTPKGPVGY